MTTVSSAPPFTPDDLLKLPDAVNYELVDGQLVERNMGMKSSLIAQRLATQIGLYLRDHPVGLLFGADAGYQCFADAPDKVRKPDVSFIRSGRLSGDDPPEGHCRIPPDIAVEVVSPRDLSYEIEEKVGEYLNAGVPLVWVVHPTTRTLRIHRPPSSGLGIVSELKESDTLSGEAVLPGFSCQIKELFVNG